MEPATVTLYQAIREDALSEATAAQAFALATAPEVVYLPGYLTETDASGSAPSVFVTREPELDWLIGHFDQALVGNGRILFVKEVIIEPH